MKPNWRLRPGKTRIALDLIKKLVPKGDYLEIGPWIGRVAYSAKKAGYNVSVIEMNDDCVSLLKRVGIHTIQSADPVQALADDPMTYDVIGLWHSIEHLPRPWEVIDQAAKRLNEGGILLVAGPNPESEQMKKLGKDWYHLDAPRHLYFLPASVVEEIGRKNGLELLDATTTDKLGKILTDHGWHHEAIRRSRGSVLVRRVITRFFKWREKARLSDQMHGAGYTVAMGRPQP